MSIFTRIKDAIFGHMSAIPSAGSRPSAVPRPSTSSSIPASPANAKWDAPASADVDVNEVLNQLAEKNGQKLDWKTSIVDLMKLLGIDSSLENRKELARELGYTADMSDSASMNIWLHSGSCRNWKKMAARFPLRSWLKDVTRCGDVL